MSVLLFIFMNGMVIASAASLAYRVFPSVRVLDTLCTAFVLYLAQIVVVELVLGLCGILTLPNILFAHGIFFGAVIFYLVRHPLRKWPGFLLEKEILGDLVKSKTVVFCITMILCFGVIKVFINLANPPFGWDSLNYHFTFPVEWLKFQNFNTPPTIFDDPSPTYYPLNGSLYYLWLILPFKSVFMADIGQVPFFIISFFAVYAICRRLSLSREYSFLASSLYLAIPNFFKQLQVAYVDVMVTALFLICVNFLISLKERFTIQKVAIFSLALGLLAGTKTVALPYSVLLVFPFIILLLRNRGKVLPLFIFIGGVFLTGGFSYIRNYLATGNPFYPLELRFFDWVVFKGVMSARLYSAHFTLKDYALSKMLFHEGLGVQTLLLVFPAALIGVPVYLWKQKKVDYGVVYFLSLPVLLYYAYRYIIPLANTRYLYPLLAVGMICGFYAAVRLRIPRRIMHGIVWVCVLASFTELAKRQELVVSGVLTLVIFLLLVTCGKYLLRLSRPIIVCVIGVSVVLLLVAEKYYAKNEFPRYLKMVKYSGFWPDAARAWNWLNDNTTGNNIAYVGRPVPFPLYGTRFKNNVQYISVNKTQPAMLHSFPGSRYQWGYDFESLHRNLEEPRNYRGGAEYITWRDNLARADIDFLFVYSLHQTKSIRFPLEDSWALAHPEYFTPVFSNDTIHIYKVIL
ncbi:MAG: hypothetical protein KKC84_02165 [Candidatus Omnitrophica bacterium]|nr:hypothetical protein [Candidatus Omnitrophota bacterium]